MAKHHSDLPAPMYKDYAELLLASEVSYTPHVALEWSLDAPFAAQPFLPFSQLLRDLDPLMSERDRAKFDAYYRGDPARAQRVAAHEGLEADHFPVSHAGDFIALGKRLLDAGGHMSLSGHDRFAGPIHAEFYTWARAGMPSARILRAATLGGAEQLGLDSDLGSLEPGKIADFVILEGDPLANVLNTTRVWAVARDGVLYDSRTLGVIDR